MWYINALTAILLLLSAVMMLRATHYALRMMRGNNLRRMFEPSFGKLCDGVGNTGLSLICLDIDNPHTVAPLLEAEYERYEVIAVIDAQNNPHLLEKLASTYALVTVDYRPDTETPASACVRRLYRSRKRRFRRLTVMDILPLSPETDADAAADIAVYDYITVIHGRIRILPCAVERIIAEISSHEKPPREIVTCAGASLLILHRDDMATQGGFASGCRHFAPRPHRRKIYETLAVTRHEHKDSLTAAALVALLWLAAALLSIKMHTALPFIAVLLSTAATLAAVLFTTPFAAPHLKGRKAFAYSLTNFCQKLLLKISQ
ncbi:MAG: hypothetical protein J1E04_02520 [Alistipes sp.]|nr:hypothetical protein [Alistipes sp.]